MKTLLGRTEFVVTTLDDGKTWSAKRAKWRKPWEPLVEDENWPAFPVSVSGSETPPEHKNCYGQTLVGSPQCGVLVLGTKAFCYAPMFLRDGSRTEPFGLLEEIRENDETGELERMGVVLAPGMWDPFWVKVVG